jgi:hypothetical protein
MTSPGAMAIMEIMEILKIGVGYSSYGIYGGYGGYGNYSGAFYNPHNADYGNYRAKSRENGRL